MRAQIRKEAILVFQKINAKIKLAEGNGEINKNIDLRATDREVNSALYSTNDQTNYKRK